MLLLGLMYMEPNEFSRGLMPNKQLRVLFYIYHIWAYHSFCNATFRNFPFFLDFSTLFQIYFNKNRRRGCWFVRKFCKGESARFDIVIRRGESRMPQKIVILFMYSPYAHICHKLGQWLQQFNSASHITFPVTIVFTL